MRLIVTLLALVASPALAGDAMVGAGVALKRNAATSAGELVSSAGAKLNNAVAEAAVSSFSGAGFKLYSGLMHLAAAPGTVTSIVAVSKATGTIELAWTAPGLDGFVGAVASGFYRIDSSSDPAHVFDPTVYSVEIPTGVVPGAAHSYRLTGLEPNTTYYSRVYLADARRVVADSSDASEEATLSRPPVSPVLSSVFSSSVAFTWSLPTPDAAGFRIDSSSSNFGALGAGAPVVSSRTDAGVTVTLTVTGLSPGTTYFFRLGSLNWQGDLNFETVIATRTFKGGPQPVENLAAAADALGRKVAFTWTVMPFDDPAGVVVQVSSNPIGASVQNGTSYAPGSVLADGSVIRSTSAEDAHLETALELDTTRYFRLYTHDLAKVYSIHVATQIVLDLPPMAPAGLSLTPGADGSSLTVRWSGVSSNSDGSSFKLPGSPSGWELSRFDVYRATGLIQPNWVLLATAPATADAYTDVPPGAQPYYYRVVAADGYGPASQPSMVVDTQRSVYVVAPDRVSRLRVPAELAGLLRASGNPYGKDVVITAVEQPADLGGRVVKSVRFDATLSPDNQPATELKFPEGQVEVTLHYEVAGGQVVPSAAGGGGGGAAVLAALEPKVAASGAAQRLGAYWFNGREYVKLYGRVDPAGQTVSVRTGMPGAYQIRTVLRESGFDFDRSGTFNKAITPNGDGLNDAAVFVFDNPKDSAVTGRVFDLKGGFVADMRAGPIANSLQWDGKAGGRAVSRGVYLYQIQAEGRAFNGTVMVIR